MVCFWWYTAGPVRVLGFLRHVPPVRHVSCILNVGWFFSPEIFHTLRASSTQHCDVL